MVDVDIAQIGGMLGWMLTNAQTGWILGWMLTNAK